MSKRENGIVCCGCKEASIENCTDENCSRHRKIKPDRTFVAPWERDKDKLKAAKDYAGGLDW